VTHRSGNTSWERVERARTRIEQGCYDSPAVIDSILASRRLDRILNDLERCPIGEGHAYRDLVAEALANCLSDVVDVPLVRREVAVEGGRADIELPLRIEALEGLPLWRQWVQAYRLRSIMVETKNEKNQAVVADVSQLTAYLSQGSFGRLGMLVTRRGFTANAMRSLAATAKRGEFLIIPMTQEHLQGMAVASEIGSGATTEFLRRRATLLLQAA
jgi:hypothetical protein